MLADIKSNVRNFMDRMFGVRRFIQEEMVGCLRETFRSAQRPGAKVFLALGLLVFSRPDSVSGASSQTGTVALLSDSEFLNPGQFEWQPELSQGGEVLVVVDLSKQLLEVWRGGVLVGRSSISSGRGQSTPIGTFSILEKNVEHYSNLYKGAPMPYMQRLGWDGFAIHAGYLPGVPASHGCIRLPGAFAKKLFEITARGDIVSVVGNSKDFRPHWARVARKNAQEGKQQVQEGKPQVLATPTVGALAKASAAPSSTPAPTAGVERENTATKGQKTMRALEAEEFRIRSDVQLGEVERMKELKRVWSEQRRLMGVALTSQ